MISKRTAAVLPLLALVVSFLAVFGLGRVFATTPENDRTPGRGGESPAPAPSTAANPNPTTADASPRPRVSRIRIVIVDVNADQPAPGLLELRPQDAGHPRRVCMAAALMPSWVPESPAGWTPEGDTICHEAPTDPLNTELELKWVRRQ